MAQYGFFIDLSRCIGCNACLTTCRQWHDITPGPTKWVRVYQWEEGAFPDIKVHTLPIMCFHCRKPACVAACPNEAIHKDEQFGAVLVDPSKCTGNRKCFDACPYGAPQFETDHRDVIMTKCNMCIDRLHEGLAPICVLSCSLRALEFGPIEELKEKYGNQAPPFGIRDTIGPSVVFKPEDQKHQVIPYDPDKALSLWQKRNPPGSHPLPDVFENADDVKKPNVRDIGRSKLVLKLKNNDELMFFTTDDE